MAKILLQTTAVRWFRRALILVVCALTPTCTASPDSTWINPQTEPPSEMPGSGGAVVHPGTGGRFGEGGAATGSGGTQGVGGKGGAAGESASGGFPGNGGTSADAGVGTPDATVPPPSDGGATDSGDAGGDASPEDGGAIDAGTGR